MVIDREVTRSIKSGKEKENGGGTKDPTPPSTDRFN
jgi:hypothetical protein